MPTARSSSRPISPIVWASSTLPMRVFQLIDINGKIIFPPVFTENVGVVDPADESFPAHRHFRAAEQLSISRIVSGWCASCNSPVEYTCTPTQPPADAAPNELRLKPSAASRGAVTLPWGSALRSAMSAEQSAAKKHPSKPTRTNLFVSSVLGGVPALVHIVLANDCWNKFVCSPYARMPQLNSAAAGRVILGYRVRAHLACAPHLRFGRLGWVFGQAGRGHARRTLRSPVARGIRGARILIFSPWPSLCRIHGLCICTIGCSASGGCLAGTPFVGLPLPAGTWLPACFLHGPTHAKALARWLPGPGAFRCQLLTIYLGIGNVSGTERGKEAPL